MFLYSCPKDLVECGLQRWDGFAGREEFLWLSKRLSDSETMTLDIAFLFSQTVKLKDIFG